MFFIMKKNLILLGLIGVLAGTVYITVSKSSSAGSLKTNADETAPALTSDEAEKVLADETVDYKISADPGVPEEFKGKKIIENYPLIEYADDFTKLDAVAKRADRLITAKVSGFSYTWRGSPETGGTAWTVIHVAVTEDLTGDIKSGETLDIYTMGGYISMRDKLGDILKSTGGKYGDKPLSDEEIDGTVYREIIGSGLPVIGGEYAFYLEKDAAGAYEFIDGGYLLKRGDLFVREVHSKDGSGDAVETYSAETLKQLLQ